MLVHANSFNDAVVAFAELETKLTDPISAYDITATHGGVLAAMWAICKVRIEQIATAAVAATTAKELAELTLPDDAAEMCTKYGLRAMMSVGNAWASSDIIRKRHFGCFRDVCETAAAACRLPTVLDGVCAEQIVSICNSNVRHAVLPLPGTNDVNVRTHGKHPVCMEVLPPQTVQHICGLYYMATQASTAAPPPRAP